MASAADSASKTNLSPGLVALAAWALPGLGYWVIGQKARGITVGTTVISLFVLGLLVGGVRALEVPTYTRLGEPVASRSNESAVGYLLRDVQAKPWSVAQAMTGPVAIIGGTGSVMAAKAANAAGNPNRGEVHARLNEIAVLYTAVAGMLNLLVIIDSAHRARKMQEAR